VDAGSGSAGACTGLRDELRKQVVSGNETSIITLSQPPSKPSSWDISHIRPTPALSPSTIIGLFVVGLNRLDRNTIDNDSNAPHINEPGPPHYCTVSRHSATHVRRRSATITGWRYRELFAGRTDKGKRKRGGATTTTHTEDGQGSAPTLHYGQRKKYHFIPTHLSLAS